MSRNRSLSIKMELPGIEDFIARARGLSDGQVEKAIRSAATFTAKDYSSKKTSTISEDVDRPAPFTKRAYNWDGAKRERGQRIVARTFVKPIQAEYLIWAEEGGEKQRQKKDGPIGIKPKFQDKYGGAYGAQGMQKKWLRRSRAKMDSGAGKDKHGMWKTGTTLYSVFKIGNTYGLWKKTKLKKSEREARRGQPGHRFGGKKNTGWKTELVISFKQRAEYDNPRLNFTKDAQDYAKPKFEKTLKRLFEKEISKLDRRR